MRATPLLTAAVAVGIALAGCTFLWGSTGSDADALAADTALAAVGDQTPACKHVAVVCVTASRFSDDGEPLADGEDDSLENVRLGDDELNSELMMVVSCNFKDAGISSSSTNGLTLTHAELQLFSRAVVGGSPFASPWDGSQYGRVTIDVVSAMTQHARHPARRVACL
jgi:hypothetical protein